MPSPEHRTATRRADVLVVGAGLMGAAATLALARRGRRVLTLEAREPGHRAGSSHGSSRIVRRAYAQPHYVAMTGRAFGLWHELERQAGVRLLTLTGGLDFGRHSDVRGMAAALTAAGVPHELMPAAAAAGYWPHLVFEGDVLYHSQAGTVDPALAVEQMVRLARELGARVEYETPVIAVDPAASGVRVRTAAGTIEAAVAVIATGPWVSRLLAGVVDLPRLTVTQQQVFYFARRVQESDPPWPIVLCHGDLETYALPGGADGIVEGNVKVAEHRLGKVTTADERDGLVDAEGERRLVEYVRRAWPGLDPEPTAALTCLYTSTSDEDFIVDRSGPLVVLSPCSGHGAKFAPLIGEWAADLVDGRAVPYPYFGLQGRT
jgi:monomeric sarcosine oxidase